jgi:lysophospholipase L1-like esterase
MMRAPPARALAGAALAVALIGAARTAWRVRAGRRLAAASRPFQTHPADARARLLVVGDSSGVGTGASSPASSVAGRLAATTASLSIDNLSRVGARFEDVVAQLARAPRSRYDAVLVMAGGNDVIALTRHAALRASVERAVAVAARLAPTVVVLPSGNLGNAPFFAWPLSRLVAARTRRMHAIVRDAAARHGATYVSLYRDRADDPFARAPGRYLAGDDLHPSDAGYALWFVELCRQSRLCATLAAR